jgi:uncharacterized protein (DUF2147 family)
MAPMSRVLFPLPQRPRETIAAGAVFNVFGCVARRILSHREAPCVSRQTFTPSTALMLPRRAVRLLRAMLFILLSCVGLSATGAQTAPSPIGTWHTINDVDGKPRGIVEIREVNGALVGTIRGTLNPEEKGPKFCDKCTDARKDQPLLGMDILTGLRRDGSEWSGGQVLDPDTGKVYKAKVRLEDGGKKLIVRGYIGISLMGRSQTWLRAN